MNPFAQKAVPGNPKAAMGKMIKSRFTGDRGVTGINANPANPARNVYGQITLNGSPYTGADVKVYCYDPSTGMMDMHTCDSVGNYGFVVEPGGQVNLLLALEYTPDGTILVNNFQVSGYLGTIVQNFAFFA
jgi:hypothetical protein